MADLTDYCADFELTTLVKFSKTDSGEVECEPLWLKSDRESGLAVFVSALDAEIYRQAINGHDDAGWERLPLSNFDLQTHIHDLGGKLCCQFIFGFSASLSGELLAGGSGAPRPLLVPTLLEVREAADHTVKFQFGKWMFDFMRQQWKIIGPMDYAAQVEAMNDAEDGELSRTAAQAINSISLTKATDTDRDWCVFAPSTASWHFGPTESRQAQHLH